MPDEYYAMMVPAWLRRPAHELSPTVRLELEQIGSHFRASEKLGNYRRLIENILPARATDDSETNSLDTLLDRFGFDKEEHEQIRNDLRSGRYGLSQNRLPHTTRIEDVTADEIVDARDGLDGRYRLLGQEALVAGKVAVVSLAAGVGSRWTEGGWRRERAASVLPLRRQTS